MNKCLRLAYPVNLHYKAKFCSKKSCFRLKQNCLNMLLCYTIVLQRQFYGQFSEDKTRLNLQKMFLSKPARGTVFYWMNDPYDITPGITEAMHSIKINQTRKRFRLFLPECYCTAATSCHENDTFMRTFGNNVNFRL